MTVMTMPDRYEVWPVHKEFKNQTTQMNRLRRIWVLMMSDVMSLHPPYRKKFLTINTAKPLEEGHVRRQARWKKAKSKDLLAMRRQYTTSATFFPALCRFKGLRTVTTPVVSCQPVAKRSSDLAFFHRACLWTRPSSNSLAVFTLKNFFLQLFFMQ